MSEYIIIDNDNDNNETNNTTKYRIVQYFQHLRNNSNKLIIYSGIFSLGLVLAIISYSLEALDYKIISSYEAFDIGQIAQVSSLLLGILVIPIFSNLSNILGRGIILALCLIFIISGSLVVGFSVHFTFYTVGFVINGLGDTVRSLIVPIILADLLSARDKSLGFILYWAPNAIALGASIPLVNATQSGDKWKFLYFSQVALVIFTGTPILLGLFRIQFNDRGRCSKLSKLSTLKAIDWIGILLLTLGLGFTLVPFTVVIRFSNGFASPKVFIPLAIGIIVLISFVIWEIKFAKSPIINSRLVRDRSTLTIIIIRAFLKFDSTLTWQYMNAYLALSRGITASEVNLINMGYKVPWFVMGFACALLVRRVSDIRSIVWISIGIYAIGVGLTIPSRSPDTPVVAVAFVEAVIGSGSGIAACTTLVILQASADPVDIANFTAIDTLLTNALASIASGIAAIIWTKSLALNLSSKLPQEYKEQIPQLIADTNKLALLPTSVKDLWTLALSDSQLLICTVSTAFAAVCFIIALTLPPIGFQLCEADEEDIGGESNENLIIKG